jgi:glycosyltransferase involved in cell wall biosynthesis
MISPVNPFAPGLETPPQPELRRPTILQVIPQLDTGGAELSTIEITEAIVKAGGEALVATEGGRLAERVSAAGGEIVSLEVATKNPATIALNGRRLARLVRARSVDLIHARSRAPAWSTLIACRMTKRPMVTTYHGAYGETNALKRLYNSVMTRSDVVIANSAFTADLIATRYRTPKDRIAIIHRGVDVARFDPARVDPVRAAALRKAWQVPSDSRIILQMARLTSWKGQAVLIDAAARLAASDRLGSTVVVLAGDAQGRSEYSASLAARANAAGIADRVRIVGHVDDVPAAFLAAHVSVVASVEPEAFGRAATESQAMGCPVIATRIGAPPETVLAEPTVAAERTTGWLVPPGDADALAAAIVEALDHSDTAHVRMGARARAHVLAEFTLQRMKQRTLSVYDQLLGTALAAASR